jgi:hypothetical protein
MTCKNCLNEFNGEYCNACGQKIADRITFKHIWNQIAEDIFNVDKGLIYTIRELWINPGKTAADYIYGKRKNYYGPIKYLILWTAIFFIISPLVAADRQTNSITKLVFNSNKPFSQENLADFLGIYMELLVRHMDLFYLGMVPFLALLSYYLFKKRGFSVTELLIPYLYLSGQMAFLLVITLPIIKFLSPMTMFLLMAITLVLFIYLVIKLHRQLFQESWIRTVIKSLTVIYVGQIIYGLTAFGMLNFVKAIS